jgi:LCP family protein required for cell wall assembly
MYSWLGLHTIATNAAPAETDTWVLFPKVMSDDDALQRKPAGHAHLRRAFLAGAASVSLLVTILAGGAMGVYFWTQNQIQYIPEPPDSGGSGAENRDIGGPCLRHACNYLLLGSDSRAGLTKEERQVFGTDEHIGGVFRSDTIIVVHVEPGEKKAVFLSFPRDLWVNIPGHGFDRINVAFEGGIEGGGAQLVARTITSITGLRINHSVYVDLAGFQSVVDALGGVDMCVPYPMQDPLTLLDIRAGCQHFDGRTALAYVRTRHQPCDLIPDFARISRQQQFLRAVLAKMLSPREIIHLPSLVPAVLKGVRVDRGLNPAELAYFAGQLNGVNTGNVDFRVVPSTPAGITVNGQYLSVVRMVEPQANELFHRLRDGRPLGEVGLTQEQTPPSPAVIKVGVYDRRSAGMASRVHTTLTEGGFDTSIPVQDVAELRPIQVNGSAILYDAKAADGKAMADVVQVYLSNLPEVPVRRSVLRGVNIAVVVGSRYVLPPPSTSGAVDCP